MEVELLVEQYPSLAALPFVRHGFVGRVPGVPVSLDKAAVIRALDVYHRVARERIGLGSHRVMIAEQVHGAGVAVVDGNSGDYVPGVDGLITADPSVCLGIYVADCCAIYMCDPVSRVSALLHSGRKGTELGIATVAIEAMNRSFGVDPANLVVQLSPCIHPPHYEVDISAEIIRQCATAGVREIHGSPADTGADLCRYYSYRMEKGCTGRMVAYLGAANG